MSVVIVAGDGRWALRHGQDPVDLLAGNGWSGDPVHAALGTDGRIEVHCAGVGADRPARGPAADVDGRDGMAASCVGTHEADFTPGGASGPDSSGES